MDESIAELLIRQLQENLNEQETNEFKGWREQTESSKTLFHQLVGPNRLKCLLAARFKKDVFPANRAAILFLPDGRIIFVDNT